MIQGVWGDLLSEGVNFAFRSHPFSYQPSRTLNWKSDFCPMITPELASNVWTIRLLRNFPVSQVAGCRCTLLVGNSSIRSCWEWGTDEFFPAVFKVLKMASESFIHALLLLLGLFLKISRWVPLRTRQIFLQIYNTLIKTLFFLPQKKFTQKQHYTMMAKSFWKEKPVCRKSVKLTQFSTKLCYSVCPRISCRSARWKSP